MAYNNLTARADIAPLIPEEVQRQIIQLAVEQSAALAMMRRVNVSRAQLRIPVLSVLPTAYFVTGDTGLKQTTEMNWANVYLNVEEIACIVPVPQAVLDDSAYDIWGEVMPRVAEEIGRTFDAAVLFGTNKPASWPDAIVPGAVAAGNVVARGTAAADAGGLAEDINQTFATVEADGFDVNGAIANRTFRALLRSARDTTGQRLVDIGGVDTVEGVNVRYGVRGQWPTGLSAAELIVGDFSQAIVAVRQDVTMDLAREGVITDNTGAIVYNLFQQDMVAMRFVARYGYAVPNPITREEATAADRWPFGVLRSPAA
jgi:HK97 family phage major capsid protein